MNNNETGQSSSNNSDSKETIFSDADIKLQQENRKLEKRLQKTLAKR